MFLTDFKNCKGNFSVLGVIPFINNFFEFFNAVQFPFKKNLDFKVFGSEQCQRIRIFTDRCRTEDVFC